MIVVTHEEDVAKHARRIVRIRDGLIASDEKVGQASRLPGEGEIADGPAAGVRPARTGETPVLRSPS
jgi:hypothetical protein